MLSPCFSLGLNLWSQCAAWTAELRCSTPTCNLFGSLTSSQRWQGHATIYVRTNFQVPPGRVCTPVSHTEPPSKKESLQAKERPKWSSRGGFVIINKPPLGEEKVFKSPIATETTELKWYLWKSICNQRNSKYRLSFHLLYWGKGSHGAKSSSSQLEMILEPMAGWMIISANVFNSGVLPRKAFKLQVKTNKQTKEDLHKSTLNI